MQRTYSFHDTTKTLPAPTFDELHSRILAVTEFYHGSLPVEHALAWTGYILALLEWQLLSIEDHAKLHDLLGHPPASPALMIALGPEGASEVMAREKITDLVEAHR